MELKKLKYETYNGVLETSERLLIIFEAFHGVKITTEDLRLFDFFAVFGEDIGLNKSLQKLIEGRANAFTFRINTIKPALKLLEDCQLIKISDSSQINITSDGIDFTMEIKSEYAKELKNVAQYMSAEAEKHSYEEYVRILTNLVEELLLQPLSRPKDNDQFDGLMQQYYRDIDRMEGLKEFVHEMSRLVKNTGSTGDNPRLSKSWLEELHEEVRREINSIKSNIVDLAIYQAEIS